MQGKLIICAAPSGSGKSTIVKFLCNETDLDLRFSVSVTTRAPREGEKDGKQYFFKTIDEFNAHVANGDFVEYEEVYPGLFYGTLKSQVDKQLAQASRHPLLNCAAVLKTEAPMHLKSSNSVWQKPKKNFLLPPSSTKLSSTTTSK